MSHIERDLQLEWSPWHQCVERIRTLIPQQQFNQWICPLQVDEANGNIVIYAPNQYVLDGVANAYLQLIKDTLVELQHVKAKVSLKVGAKKLVFSKIEEQPSVSDLKVFSAKKNKHPTLNKEFTFENFVVGNSNHLAKSAATEVSNNPGLTYNPLYLYGDVGLGKTHLMHAVGNLILAKNSKAKIVYLHSEQFVADMVKAIKNNAIAEFKKHYRSADALLIDDVQFLAGKGRSQEEFFHTFNALMENKQQIIMTSDRYPKEIMGMEERLKSRFGSGLTVTVQAPELETRVEILLKKAEKASVNIGKDVATFIAKRVRSNVRELEGTLKRVIANAHFSKAKINIAFVQEVLSDLFSLNDKLVSIENILNTVARYYKLNVTDLLSKSRARTVTRPRQMAMAICKELTSYSLAEIGFAFGKRDHTTVLHACRQVKLISKNNLEFTDDFLNIVKILST